MKNYLKTQPEMRAHLGLGPVIPYPECEKCKKSDAVRVQAGSFASDFWCLRCKTGWEQPW